MRRAVSIRALEQPGRHLEAHEPPEVRGSGRDDVAMLVAGRHEGSLVHARFGDLPEFLEPGDLLVVNTSATLPAALTASLGERQVELRLSTPAPGASDRHWVVELRTAPGLPFRCPSIPSVLRLPDGARAELVARYAGSDRLSVARLDLGAPLYDYLARYGRPIRYSYVPQAWPLDAYQTVFAQDPGSAEMPSAGRPFTAELVTELVSSGVLVAPVTLHTGVSSPELGELPYPERYRVPEATAHLVNSARAWGGRVIAVGTTVVRALESVVDSAGAVRGREGWTNLVITPDRGLRVVDGLLSGWHEPEASHLQMLEAVAGTELLRSSYRVARERGYLWHEFGDLHLILP
jgi:S-adenosylmethionine:tRNA ribosyltransferase-isomerase